MEEECRGSWTKHYHRRRSPFVSLQQKSPHDGILRHEILTGNIWFVEDVLIEVLHITAWQSSAPFDLENIKHLYSSNQNCMTRMQKETTEMNEGVELTLSFYCRNRKHAADLLEYTINYCQWNEWQKGKKRLHLLFPLRGVKGQHLQPLSAHNT